MRYMIDFERLTVITGGKQNSIMCCVATRNTLPKNTVSRLIMNNGMVFGKSPLRILLNTYCHNQNRKMVFSSIDSEIDYFYLHGSTHHSVIRIHERKGMIITRQDFSLQEMSLRRSKSAVGVRRKLKAERTKSHHGFTMNSFLNGTLQSL